MTPAYLKPPRSARASWPRLIGLVLVAGTCSGGSATGEAPPMVVDLHADTPWLLVKRGGYSLRHRHDFAQVDVPKLREGGYGAQFFSIWPPPEEVAGGRAEPYCRRSLAAIRRAIGESAALEVV